MLNRVLKKEDAQSARQAECYVTVGTNRYYILSAINFEAKVNIKTAEVKSIGRLMTAHKAIGAEGSFKMTVYKCSPMFTDMVMDFLKTGIMPTFDIQITNEDNASKIGRDTKIYIGCQIDGDVLFSMLDQDGELIEQEINGYFDEVISAEDYHNPEGI